VGGHVIPGWRDIYFKITFLSRVVGCVTLLVSESNQSRKFSSHKKTTEMFYSVRLGISLSQIAK